MDSDQTWWDDQMIELKKTNKLPQEQIKIHVKIIAKMGKEFTERLSIKVPKHNFPDDDK